MFYLLIFGLPLVLFAVVYFILRLKVTHHKPDSFPTKVNKIKSDKSVLVCLGDSNTHGNVSYDWVKDLQNEMPDFQIYNAGLNSDLTFSLLTRIDDVIECDPDFISILIGTNDVNAYYSKDALRRYVDIKKIGKNQIPNHQTFEENLDVIVKKLKSKTNAKISLMTLPLMGEDIENKVNKIADAYSFYIENVAIRYELELIPIRKLQKDYIVQNPSQTHYHFNQYFMLLNKSVILHYIFGYSWNKISEINKTQLSPDFLHQNEKSGIIIKNEVINWIKNGQ